MRGTRESASTGSVVFVAENRLQLPFGRLQFFAVTVPAQAIPRLCGPPAVTARKTTELYFAIRTGKPVTVRHNRPLLCLASRHQSESLPYRLGFSRFDRRVLPVLPVLADRWVGTFLFAEKPDAKKGGMQVTPEEKKAWAEDLLRSKCRELGRLPTKKDFNSATCAQIKAYLGPWPRALESAGLKEPREKKTTESQ